MWYHGVTELVKGTGMGPLVVMFLVEVEFPAAKTETKVKPNIRVNNSRSENKLLYLILTPSDVISDVILSFNIC